MAEHVDDGGQAFPAPHHQCLGKYGGMSLRDYFAAAALTHRVYDPRDSLETLAKVCYAIADAMIKAKKGWAE